MHSLEKGRMVTWESSLAGESSEQPPIRKWRRFILELLDKRSHFRKNQNHVALKIIRILSRSKVLDPVWLRFLLTRLLPFDPLREEPENLEIFIFTSQKDLQILPLSILGSSQCHTGKITRITIVHPEIIQNEVSAILDSVSESDTTYSQVSDEELLETHQLFNHSFGHGNIKMEVVKIIVALGSKERFSLLIDGDTVLLRPRNWATSKNYLLLVAQEYSRSHINYNKRVIKGYRFPGLGFVTHHQLIKTKNITDIVALFGGVNELAKSFDHSSSSFYLNNGDEFPSEWQLIGDFEFMLDPKEVRLVNFSNLGLSRNKMDFLFTDSLELPTLKRKMDFLRTKSPGLGSISFHQYKD
jgi:hypothetical protein